MGRHEALCERAKKAINDVFNDKSVSQEATVLSLKDIRDEIDTLLDAL